MKKSAVWTTAAIAAVGFGVPAYAAISSPGQIRQIAPTPVVSVAAPDNTIASISSETTITIASLPDDTLSSIAASVNASDVTEASTPNSVEDVSGNCDEPEHVNDASCAGTGSTVADNSGPGSNNSGDNSGHNAAVDNSGRGSSGGGSDDSGHGSNDG